MEEVPSSCTAVVAVGAELTTALAVNEAVRRDGKPFVFCDIFGLKCFLSAAPAFSVPLVRMKRSRKILFKNNLALEKGILILMMR